MNDFKQIIESGQAIAGIEFGSTRVKLVLIDPDNRVISSGGYTWESVFIDGYWTYSLLEIEKALQSAYKELKENIKLEYGITLKKLSGFGISGMMHGYIALDKEKSLLVPFRTWRNTTTSEAATMLTETFHYPIPERWSIAHLYQALLNKEKHIEKLHSVDTLATYVHTLLTGTRVAGIGEASGMFPIDLKTKNYHSKYLKQFQALVQDEVNLIDLFPEVKTAGDLAGTLTNEGALLIDPEGDLEAGIPFCPPEGDAGTGMIATNAIKKRTGNISAGTSVFAMFVLEKEIDELIPNIDLVTTPNGNLVAMVHSNNCTADSNQWIRLFGEVAQLTDPNILVTDLYEPLYQKALEGDVTGGGLLQYGYVSGEHITNIHSGIPLFVRMPDSQFTLANFMRTQIYSAIATLRIGMTPLLEKGLVLDSLMGHGGLFKTKGVGEQLMADALNTNINVLEHSGEGGAWGIAVLANFIHQTTSLEVYLDELFKQEALSTVTPDPIGVKGFDTYLNVYQKGLQIERTAEELLK